MSLLKGRKPMGFQVRRTFAISWLKAASSSCCFSSRAIPSLSVFRRCGCVDPVTGRQYGTRCPRLGAGGRHGSWYVRLELPGGLDGRRCRIRRGGYPSRKAALEVLGRLRSPKAGGTGGIITAGDWLVSRTSPAASTVRGYAVHVRLYLGLYLGEVLLTELTTGQVQAMFTAIIRQHQALGTPVSVATLTRIRATLR